MSFTSISGPSLDHAGRSGCAIGTRGSALGCGQFAHSYYTLLFQPPRVPEAAIRRGLLERTVGKRSRSDQVNGLNLYRANMFAALRAPRPQSFDIPVQVIAPGAVPFITPVCATEAPAPFATNLRTRLIEGGHWVVKDDAALIADYVRDFALG